MEAYEALVTRRSIRAYTAQTISDDLIKQLLEAAMSAPSASNRQPWHFVVVAERQPLDALADLLPFGKMLEQAPLAIVVCGDLALQPEGYWIQDCSAATQNILLAAHAKGLGAVWLGVYPREERVAEIRTRFGLPEHVIPLCVLSIGYPSEPGGRVDRYQAARVHTSKW